MKVIYELQSFGVTVAWGTEQECVAAMASSSSAELKLIRINEDGTRTLLRKENHAKSLVNLSEAKFTSTNSVTKAKLAA